MNSKNKSLASLIWIVFVDSMGWGIAFSIFAELLFKHQSSILPAAVSDTSRYMLYEFLLAVYCIVMFFFAPILGGISDRYGRKPGLKISMAGLTFGFILNAMGCFWSNIWLLIFGRIISGMTAGSMSIAQAAAVDISTPQTKSFYLSIMMVSNCLGFSLGPVLGDLIMKFNNGPVGFTTFIISAGMSIIGYVSIELFFEESYVPKKPESQFSLFKDFANIKIAFSKPILKNYLSAQLFSMLAFGLFFSNVPVNISRAFVSHAADTGILLSFESIVFCIPLMLGGKFLFTYFSKTNMVFCALIIQFISYLILSANIHSYVAVVSLFTVISALSGVMYIAFVTLVSDVTENDWQGRVMGVVAALSSVTWGVGPLLTGVLNAYRLSFVFFVSSMLILISMIILRKLAFNNKAVSVSVS